MTSDVKDKLGALVRNMLGAFGGAFSVPTARIGYRLAVVETHGSGAVRVSQPAARTGLAKPYVREWALAQAANRCINRVSRAPDLA